MPHGFPPGLTILIPLAAAAIGAQLWAWYEARCLRQELDELLYLETATRDQWGN